jgi:uncharacterized protein
VHVHEEPDGNDVADLRYEVMYLLDADDAKMHAFREVWSGIGDSIVIVGGDGLYNCHIHTDEIGAAIEAALDAGRPARDPRHRPERAGRRGALGARGQRRPARGGRLGPAPTTAVVAVVVGDGVGRIFRSLGVRTLVGGQSMNPSTADLVAAVRETGSTRSCCCPTTRTSAPSPSRSTRWSTRTSPSCRPVRSSRASRRCSPTTPTQRRSRTLARDVRVGVQRRGRRGDPAVRDTSTDAGEVHVGDWIGLGDHGVRSIADSIAGAANQLLATLVKPEHELVTIIEGDGSTPANTRRITEFLADEYPDVSVEVHQGGQPLYPYYFGIE